MAAIAPSPSRLSPPLVGRESELATLRRVLEPGGPSVAFITGVAGVGKSALLNAFAEAVERGGGRVVSIDGRAGDLTAERLAEAVASVDGDEVLMVDSYEQMLALGHVVRAELARRAITVLVASRLSPEPDWLRLGAPLLLVGIEPLRPAASFELITRAGLSDPAAQGRIVAWAHGSPLALMVATAALLAGRTVDLDRLDGDPTLARTLLERVAGHELQGQDREIIAVAAIAPAVDARLLAALLPGLDGDHAEAWLRGLSFAEARGLRTTLHDSVRKAVRAVLLAEDREHERDLRRRIADHLHARAVLGEGWLWADLTALIDHHTVPWAVAPSRPSHQAGPPGPGNEAAAARALGVTDTQWWAGVRRWIERTPEQVVSVRDPAGALRGLGLWATTRDPPAWADEDPILAAWLGDARRRTSAGEAVLLRDALDVAGQDASVLQVSTHAAILRSGLVEARYLYAGAERQDAHRHELLTTLGYARAPEIDVEDGERSICGYVADLGPGGAVGRARDAVYRDLGCAPPGDQPPQTIASDVVRDALRCFHQPVALAASPLARGGTEEERAASVRRVLHAAVDAAFGASDEERLQRAVLSRGYLDADGGHSVTQRELHLGRSAYFRRLADASAVVSDYLLRSRR